MVLDCKLCGQWSYTKYICQECNIVKDCMNLYGRDTVIKVLQKVLVRDEQQRINKVELNKQLQNRVSQIEQNVTNKIITRSNKK